MRCLARHLFRLCSAVSLVLCGAVCVAWARSYRVADFLDTYPAPGVYFGAASHCGLRHRLLTGEAGYVPQSSRLWRTMSLRIAGPPGQFPKPIDRPRYTFRKQNGRQVVRGTMHMLELPYGVSGAAAAAAPAAWLAVRLRRSRRTVPSLCSLCGCDLRAGPWRCPECGTAAQKGSL